MTEAIPEKSLFKRPDIHAEMGEFVRVGQTYGLDESVLTYLAEYEGSIVTLDNEMWSQLENTDSYEIAEGDWLTVSGHSESASRDYMNLREKLEKGITLDAPIIMKIGQKLHLVSGNTRLMVSRAMGLQPQVYVFEVDNHEA